MIDPADPHLPLDMFTISWSLVPILGCYYGTNKNEALRRPEHIAPEKKGRLKRMVYYTDSRIFVNLSVLKSETLEIPTVVMISEKKSEFFRSALTPFLLNVMIPKSSQTLGVMT